MAYSRAYSGIYGELKAFDKVSHAIFNFINLDQNFFLLFQCASSSMLPPVSLLHINALADEDESWPFRPILSTMRKFEGLSPQTMLHWEIWAIWNTGRLPPFGLKISESKCMVQRVTQGRLSKCMVLLIYSVPCRFSRYKYRGFKYTVGVWPIQSSPSLIAFRRSVWNSPQAIPIWDQLSLVDVIINPKIPQDPNICQLCSSNKVGNEFQNVIKRICRMKLFKNKDDFYFPLMIWVNMKMI